MSNLISRLPPVRGKLAAEVPLRPMTWFRVGGPAEVMFHPEDEADLASFLAACPPDVPLTVMGLASNLLVRDGGLRGVLIKLGANFGSVRIEGQDIFAGAGIVDLTLARAAQKAGIGGFCFLTGIPGTLGGALRMNAGAYGGAMEDITISVEALDRQGQKHILSAQDMGFSYRHTKAAPDLIFTAAHLRGKPEDPAILAEAMQKIQKERGESQPVRERTGGSTFANPENDPQNRRAWELIDAAGCRGLTQGGALVSPQHCNFLINTGEATAKDLESLGEEVRRRVLEKTGTQLHWEIRRIGDHSKIRSAQDPEG